MPVHIIPEIRWKDLGKHVNNVIMMSTDERVIDSIIFKKGEKVTLTSKLGMVKQVLLDDLEVTRYSKPMTVMKLKDGDELVSVKKSLEDTLIVTNNGFYLRYKTSEISILGSKASGVKGINLKDDYVI